jgi:hypothetical protein
MVQPSLFHDSILDAVLAGVMAAGGRKVVAGKLWPSLDPETASARLRAGLNPDRQQKLGPLELLAIARLARAAGDHSLMRFLAHELGYAEPQPVDPVDQRAALQHQFIAAVEALSEIQRAMARVPGPPLVVVNNQAHRS